MSGLKINFLKSVVVQVNHDDYKDLKYSKMFNCSIGDWPIKFLEVSVSGSRLHVATG